MKNLKLYLVVALLIFSSATIFLQKYSYGEIVFEDNFDNQPDWSPTQLTTGSVDCWEWNGCSSILPNGYAGYRMQRSYYTNKGHNTLNIDSTNHRGSSGKAFTFWNETCTSCGWASDGLLALKLADYNSGYHELYVRFFIKFDPTWQWDLIDSSMQKFF